MKTLSIKSHRLNTMAVLVLLVWFQNVQAMNSNLYKYGEPQLVGLNKGLVAIDSITDPASNANVESMVQVACEKEEAAWDNENAIITWNALLTNSNGWYKIERSIDGSEFSQVSVIEIEQVKLGVNQKFNYTDYNLKGTVSKRVQYRVIYMYSNGSDVKGNIVTLNNSKAAISLSIYPNPATSYIQIENAQEIQDEDYIMITDAQGKKFSEPIQWKNMSNKNISVEMLPEGVYYLRIQSAMGVQSIKFFKN